MATSTPNQGVPGVPQAALDAIQDENTRLVIQAIVDGWHVRNGAVGNGDNAFITRGEFTKPGVAGSPTNMLGAIIQGQLGQALNQLHTRVFESQLYKALGTRIDLIDTANIANGNTIAQEITNRQNADNAIYQSVSTQVSAINGNIAGLQTSQTTTANNVAALTQTITTLQATVGQNTAAIAQESLVRANADGDLYAQWTLRVDVNGRVSGFGLASDANSSDFIIRADRFSLVSPTGNYAALIMTNNTIHVFDENGTLRVKLGRLT